MRLLIFSTEFPPGPGGIGTHAYQLARHLLNAGWEVIVLSQQDYASESEISIFNHRQPFEVQTLRHMPGAPLEAIYRWHQLRHLIDQWNPDLLIATGEQAVLLAAGASLQIPWVAIWHGVIPPACAQRKLSAWAYQQATQIISVSNYSRNQLSRLGVQPRKETVITNGADETVFHCLEDERIAAFRHSVNMSSSPMLLTVGNMSERKGQDIVIRALKVLRKEIPDLHYLIVGLPTRRNELQQLAIAEEVAGNVHFLAQVDHKTLVEAYNACDVFVLTSRHSRNGEFEGYGIVVVEAAFCGKPAVVTENSGLAEAVVDGFTGLVVPENDPERTAAAILGLLKDPARRRAMGLNAQQRALEKQTWSVVMRAYDQELRSLLPGGRN